MTGSSPNQPEPAGQPEVSAPSAAISSINPAASEMAVPRKPEVVAAPAPAAVEPAAVVEPTAEIVIERKPERAEPEHDFEAYLDELASNVAGSLSPFGEDVEFPLPTDRLSYRHPGPANRPALAGE